MEQNKTDLLIEKTSFPVRPAISLAAPYRCLAHIYPDSGLENATNRTFEAWSHLISSLGPRQLMFPESFNLSLSRFLSHYPQRSLADHSLFEMPANFRIDDFWSICLYRICPRTMSYEIIFPLLES
jgi:hypothetical protein